MVDTNFTSYFSMIKRDFFYDFETILLSICIVIAMLLRRIR